MDTRQFTIESLLVSINRLKKDEYVHQSASNSMLAINPYFCVHVL